MRPEAKGYRLVFGYLGIFLAFEGLVTFVPLSLLAFYPREYECWLDYAIPGIVAILIGALLYGLLLGGRPKARFAKNEDSLLLILLWLSAILIGALPFYLSQFSILSYGNSSVSLGLNFTESIFESTSAYSTTGLTVFPNEAFLTGPDSSAYVCAHVYLFHRAFMQFVGGVGLVLIVASAISDRYNLKLYFAEGHNDRLMPNLGRSAKLIFGIYFGLVVVGAFSLWLAGMTPFDAICHSASAISTGGFGTRSANVAFYQTSAFAGNGVMGGNSLAIEVILMALMLAGATNIVLHTFLLTGKIRKYLQDIEVRLAFFIVVFFTILSTLSTLYLFDDGITTGLNFWASLRYSVFNVVSSLTTTGFSNYADFHALPSAGFSQYSGIVPLGEAAVFISIVLMTIGGGVGSTGGGIKQYRIGLMLKECRWSAQYKHSSSRTINPHPVTRLGETKEVDREAADESRNYVVLYLIFLTVGSLATMLLPLITCEQGLYQFASALSDSGLSIVDFFAYKAASLPGYLGLLWILTAGMFFGRLEILPAYFGMSRLVGDPLEKLLIKHKKSAPSDP